MTNFEKLRNEITIEEMAKRIDANYYCDECPCEEFCRTVDFMESSCEKTRMKWLNRPVDILDKVEKEYLKAVLAPWLKRKDVDIEVIKYISCTDSYYWLEFNLYDKNRDDDNDFSLPPFYSEKMYAGMETYKYYTVEELGLR